MSSRDGFNNLPPLVQVVIGAVIILFVVFFAITLMDTWNKSVTPTLSEEGQKQTKEAQDRFWGSIALVGFAGILIVIAIVLKAFGII
jgi:hypothetical protein